MTQLCSKAGPQKPSLCVEHCLMLFVKLSEWESTLNSMSTYHDLFQADVAFGTTHTRATVENMDIILRNIFITLVNVTNTMSCYWS